MQKELSYHMLAAFAEAFRDNPMPAEIQRVEAERGGAAARPRWHGADLSRMKPEDMEAVLADTVLKEFKIRLGRIGVQYHTPTRP